MSPAGAVLRARAYLLRVAEPPAPALLRLIAAVGPVEAAARVRAGAVPESVARETAARRAVDRVDDDLAAAHACGARLLTPEDPAWPHWAFTALENAAHGPPDTRDGDVPTRANCPPAAPAHLPSTPRGSPRRPPKMRPHRARARWLAAVWVAARHPAAAWPAAWRTARAH